MLEHFVAYLQNDETWLKDADGIAASKSMDAIVLMERLRKRKEGEACPWKDDILKKLLSKRMYTPQKTCQEAVYSYSYQCQSGRTLKGTRTVADPANPEHVHMELWAMLKPATQEAMLKMAIRLCVEKNTL